jgi:uncharacterized protein YqeY
MSLKEQIMADMKEAMRSGDTLRRDALRMLRSAIKNAEIEAGKELDDAGTLKVIQKEAKTRRESIEEFGKGGRNDLVEQEKAALEVIDKYLPRMMEREEIEAEAKSVIEEVGASGPGDLGKVMRPLMGRLQGRADGRLVNEVVRELLAES